jgi:hypothetical protein
VVYSIMGAMESRWGGGREDRGGRRSSRTKPVHESSRNESRREECACSPPPPLSPRTVNRPSSSLSCGNDHHPGTFASSSKTRALAHCTPFTEPRGLGVASSTVSSKGGFAPGSDAAHPGSSSREDARRAADRNERGPTAVSDETRRNRLRAPRRPVVHAGSATAGGCRRWEEPPPPHLREHAGRALRATARGTAGSAAVTDIAPRSIGRVPLDVSWTLRTHAARSGVQTRG